MFWGEEVHRYTQTTSPCPVFHGRLRTRPCEPLLLVLLIYKPFIQSVVFFISLNPYNTEFSSSDSRLYTDTRVPCPHQELSVFCS